MTLDELERALRDRKAHLNVDASAPSCAVSIIGPGRRGKVAQADADRLEDAVEVALLRYDATWKVG